MKAPIKLTAKRLAQMPLPSPPEGEGKEGRGSILIIGGGAQVPGALILAGEAALRAGAGKLQMAVAGEVATALGLAVPEARVIAVAARPDGEMAPKAASELAVAVERCNAVVVGPGMMDELSAGRLMARLARLETKASFVIDAAALTGVKTPGALSPLAGRMVLTPHSGEMAALLDISREEVEADAAATALAAAKMFQAVVALKGATTFIAAPSGEIWMNEAGVVGLGTSGSGDVLAGIIGGLLARGADPVTAATWGVFLHAAAGERLAKSVGPLGFIAREIAGEIPALMASLSAAA